MVALSLNTITNFLFGQALIRSPTYGEIMADVKMSEDHTRKNEETQNTLESGAVIAGHVIIHPRVLSINFGVTNTGWTSLLESRSQEIFDKLDNISRTQELITVTTEHYSYTNMMISNVRMLHSAPYKGSLQVSCDFEELNFSDLQVIKNANVVSQEGGIGKSLTNTVNAGKQQVQKMTGNLKSTLSGFVS